MKLCAFACNGKRLLGFCGKYCACIKKIISDSMDTNNGRKFCHSNWNSTVCSGVVRMKRMLYGQMKHHIGKVHFEICENANALQLIWKWILIIVIAIEVQMPVNASLCTHSGIDAECEPLPLTDWCTKRRRPLLSRLWGDFSFQLVSRTEAEECSMPYTISICSSRDDRWPMHTSCCMASVCVRTVNADASRTGTNGKVHPLPIHIYDTHHNINNVDVCACACARIHRCEWCSGTVQWVMILWFCAFNGKSWPLPNSFCIR